MKFFQLDPRLPKDQQPQVDLGIEDTLGVSKHNIDHHGPDDTAETPSACEQMYALHEVPVAETIATVRPDIDSITAMAIYKSRLEHEGNIDQLDKPLIDKIGMLDRFGPRVFEADFVNADERDLLIGLGSLSADFRRSMEERVDLARQILERRITEDLQAMIDQLVKQRNAEYESALADTEVTEVIEGQLAYVKSTHRFATQIGYEKGSTVVAFNPEMAVMAKNEATGRFQPTGETYRKYTICRYDSHVPTDISAILTELNALESGWGGRGDIIGSPQNSSSVLSEEQVLAIVEKHVRLGKIRRELEEYGSANGLRGLVGRMQRGLDPAGMIAVEETLGALEDIGNALGVDLVAFIRLTNALHVGAIWDYVDAFRSGNDPALQLWMVAGEACVSGKEKESDLTPEEFLKDVQRVEGLLAEAVVNPQAFVQRAHQELVGRAEAKFVLEDGVPMSEVDDGFLSAALCGYSSAVVKDKDGLMFVGAQALDYQALIHLGLAEVTRFDERRGCEVTFWVDQEGVDVVKVLYPGFCIVFQDRSDVAKALAKTA